MMYGHSDQIIGHATDVCVLWQLGLEQAHARQLADERDAPFSPRSSPPMFHLPLSVWANMVIDQYPASHRVSIIVYQMTLP